MGVERRVQRERRFFGAGAASPILFVVIPALLTALGLYIASEIVVEKEVSRWLLEGRRATNQAVLTVLKDDAGSLASEAKNAEPSRAYGVGLFTAAAALLLGIGISLRRRAQIDGYVEHIAKRIEEFTEGGATGARPDLPKEIHVIDASLSKLKERFDSMRQLEMSVLESGRSSREMKAQFFAGMSHDLRSPLNSIIGFTDLLLKEMEGPLADEQRQSLLRMAEDAEKLMVLIADILDTSKLEAGQFELDRTWVPSVEVLTDCTSEALRLIGTKPVYLESALQPGLPPVHIDKNRIRQALVSLIARVVSAVDSGTITLKASLEREPERGESKLRVDIIDSGRAISPKEQERIRAAFNSMQEVSSENSSGGLGLGIALARDIVRLHGGELDVLAQAGSPIVFSVTLPLDESPD